MNQLSTAARAQIIRCLVEGNSIRATSRLTGSCKEAIMRLLGEVGQAAGEYQETALSGIRCQRVQCDEIWSFVGCKEYHLPPEKRGKGRGDAWTWTALDPDSKLVVAWWVGTRSGRDAMMFMQQVADRVIGQVQMTTDAFVEYKAAIDMAFGSRVDYATAVKKYHSVREDLRIEARYSPKRCKEVKKKVIFGDPNPHHITTSHNERNNLTMRMCMRRFTRLTNAFSKKLENHIHAINMHMLHYNFARIHGSLRVTPAMAAGISDHVWEVEEIVELLNRQAQKAA